MNGFMKDFIITTDTTTDLPASYVNEHHLGMMSLPYTIENQTYTWEHSLPEKEFYAMMRNGSLPTTSQANPEEAPAWVSWRVSGLNFGGRGAVFLAASW